MAWELCIEILRYMQEIVTTQPENLLYSTPHQDALIKVSDFGLARFISPEVLATTTCGTPGYVAPEILEGKKYNESCDYWSIGVVLYILLCGFPPFYDESNQKLFTKIKKADYDFPSPYWDHISDEGKDLISKLLVVEPDKRLNGEEILMHPWITGHTEFKKPIDLKDKMRAWNTKRKMK